MVRKNYCQCLKKICQSQNIDTGENKSYKEMIDQLLQKIDASVHTVKISGREVRINHHNRRLVYANNSITLDYVHMLCRKHDITWRQIVPCEVKQKEEDRTKAEIIANIVSEGHTIPRGRLRKKDIVEIAEKYGIATKKTI